MAKRESWYRVVNDALSASTTIDGIRLAKTLSLRKGDIAPLAYFQAVSNDRFQILTSRGDIQPYNPNDDEYELLYTVYPATMPEGAVFSAKPDGIMAYKRAWYRIEDTVPYGLAALVDIEGVCKRGDVAFAGEIVPASFFAGLSLEQFGQLESYGLIFQSYLDTLAPDVRQNTRVLGYLNRYAPSPFELPSLYERFPAMQPQAPITEHPKASKKVKE